MKKIIIILFFGLFVLWFFILSSNMDSKNENAQLKTELSAKSDTLSDWQLLTYALIWQESKGINPNCLQITEIYVKELNNRGYTFVYNDVFDRVKSIEMFNAYNEIYNPDKDIIRAIELHNPTASGKYLRDVLLKYNTLKNITKN